MTKTYGLYTPEPHHIPGYTGHCPKYKYSLGETYGIASHKILVADKYKKAEKSIPSDNICSEFQIDDQWLNRNERIVQDRFVNGETVYNYSITSGYGGFVPRLAGKFGRTQPILMYDAIAEFEKAQKGTNEKSSRLQGHHQFVATASDSSQIKKAQIQLPIDKCRPKASDGHVKDPCVPENPCVSDAENMDSPYFMDVCDRRKYFITGYDGHVPYQVKKFGSDHQSTTNEALCEFTTKYDQRKQIERKPVSVAEEDLPLLIQPTQLYHTYIGMMPNYTGHVPGIKFRFGKTYGNDSTNAKRWLKGDFSF